MRRRWILVVSGVMFSLSVVAEETVPKKQAQPRKPRRVAAYNPDFVAFDGILESAEPYYPLSPQSKYYNAPKADAFRIAEQYYKKVIGKVAPTNVPFADVYLGPFRVPRGNIDISENVYGKSQTVRGQEINIGIGIGSDTNCLNWFSNRALFRYIQTNDTQAIPSLSLEQAYAQAISYLTIFDVKIDNRAAVAELSWGMELGYKWATTSIWQVVWTPSDGGYRYDEFVKNFYNPCISVSFSEKYGFVSFSQSPFPPPPKTTEVRISRESAIFKAEKAVPLVMRTPYYQQCRLPGFKVSGVKSAELRIACPNWLLDPARAIWIWDSPPKETRLCWIVRFTTVDTVKREDGFLPLSPDILIYIDAATGEIVGANFT